MNALTWIITPVSGAVIGYFTNWLAIKMLFRPHVEKRFLGVSIPFTPGLIPKERYILSKKVSETLTANVLTDEVLVNSLLSPEFTDKLSSAIDELMLRFQSDERTVDELLTELMGSQKEAVFSKIDIKIADYLPEAFISELKGAVASKVPDLELIIRDFTEKNSDLEDKLRKLTAKIASEQFGKLIGIFVNYDKIYDNIKENFFKFLAENENQQMLAEKASGLIDEFFGKDIMSISYVSDLRNKVLQQKIGDLFSKLPPDSVKKIILKSFRFVLEKGGPYAVRSLNLSGIVEEKINAFSTEEAEKIILSVVNKELKMITVLGGVLGFIIGLVPAIINSF